VTVRTSTAIIGTLTAAMVLVPFTVLPVARASAIDWTQLGSTIDGTGVGDHAGSAVALSGDGTVLAIGAPDFTGSVGTARGLVRVYEWNGSAWMQRGADLEGAENNSDWGASVALSYDGSVLAIGAPNANSSLGGGGRSSMERHILGLPRHVQRMEQQRQGRYICRSVQ